MAKKGGITMRIGIMVATKPELEPFIRKFGSPAVRFCRKNSFDVMKWSYGPRHSVFLILSGVGEIASAMSAQYLIDCFHVDGIINYGVAGGLHQDTDAGKLGIIEKVIHTDFDITLSGKHVIGEYPNGVGPLIAPKENFVPDQFINHLPRFICASADKFIGAGEPKQRLRREFNADICEMEAAGVLFTCNRNNTPVTLIKAVSDGMDEDSDAFDCNVYRASLSCVKVIESFVHSY